MKRYHQLDVDCYGDRLSFLKSVGAGVKIAIDSKVA